jgi:hypothetical protein
MKINGIRYGILTLTVLSLVTACNQPPVTNKIGDLVRTTIAGSKSSISGIAEFPNNKLTVKAVLNDLTESASVTLINSVTKIPVGTGLTDSGGAFTLNPPQSFQPAVNDKFFLEATKRNGGSGNTLMSIRTLVKWTAGGWAGITSPVIKINTKTTALAVMAELDTEINFDSLINSINSSGIFTPAPHITQQKLTDVADLVTDILNANGDPGKLISFKSGSYYISNPPQASGSKILGDVYLYHQSNPNRIFMVYKNGIGRREVVSSPAGVINDTDGEYSLLTNLGKIVYRRYDFNYSTNNYTNSIYTTDVSTGETVNITPSLAVNQFSMSRMVSSYGGTKQIFGITSGVNKGIWMVKPDLSVVKISDDAVMPTTTYDYSFFNTSLIKFYSNYPDAGNSWSPDNSKFFFRAYSTGNRGDLYMVYTTGGTTTKILTAGIGGAFDSFSGKWSADSNKIGFTIGSPRQLWMININGTNTSQLLVSTNSSFENSTQFIFSPDGSKVAWGSRTTNVSPNKYEVFVSPTNSAAPISVSGNLHLTSMPNFSGGVQWSPDSSKIIFQGKENGQTINNIFVATASSANSAVNVSKSINSTDSSIPVFTSNSRVVFTNTVSFTPKLYYAEASGSGNPSPVSSYGNYQQIIMGQHQVPPNGGKYFLRLQDTTANSSKLALLNNDATFTTVFDLIGSSSQYDFPIWLDINKFLVGYVPPGQAYDLYAGKSDGTIVNLTNTPTIHETRGNGFYPRP